MSEYLPAPSVVREWLTGVIESKVRAIAYAQEIGATAALQSLERELACANMALHLLEDR